MNKEKCCICGGLIDEAHNPAPLKNTGVCCSYCNNHLVIPARLGVKIYICTKDLEDGDWCVGCMETIDGWREKAIEWATWDGAEDIVKILKSIPQDKIIIYISSYWNIVLEEYKL